MKNIKKFITAVIVIAMTFVMVLPVLAAYKQSIYLPANQAWMTAGTASRNINYSSVSARCHSVYPDSGTDNFQVIQCRVLTASGLLISDVVKLNETAGDYTSIKIKEGYLASSPVTF